MNIKPGDFISTSLDLSGAISSMTIAPQGWESGPHQFRLMHKRTGAYVLQGSFHVWELNCATIEWRDISTVEEEPEKPKNDWARPTKWGGRV